MHKPEELNGKTILSADLGEHDEILFLTFTDGTAVTVMPKTYGYRPTPYLDLTLKEKKS